MTDGRVPEKWRKWTTMACVAALAVSFVVMVGAAGGYLSLRSRMKGLLATGSDDRGAAEEEKKEDDKTSAHEKITKNNIFMANRVPTGPSVALTGFYEDAALLAQGDNVKMARVGETVFGVKVVSMDGTSVDVEWNGKPIHWALFPPTRGGGPPSGPPSGGPPSSVSSSTGPAGPPSAPAGAPPTMGGFRRMPPGGREALRERFRNMSPEERERLREQFRGRGGGRRRPEGGERRSGGGRRRSGGGQRQDE